VPILARLTGESDARRTFRSTSSPTVSPADACAALGPRSLDPVRSFWSAFAELIWDQTSPTDFCNCTSTCGQPNPGSFDSRRDGGLDLLPFLTCHALSLAGAVTRGEPRSVRTCRPQCWFLPVPRVCPTVMPTRSPHHSWTFARECRVRIDRHGSKDRAKDASSEHTYDLSCACRVHALDGACRRRSPPRRPPDIRCRRCGARGEDTP
jgi:hypothetical protein